MEGVDEECWGTLSPWMKRQFGKQVPRIGQGHQALLGGATGSGRFGVGEESGVRMRTTRMCSTQARACVCVGIWVIKATFGITLHDAYIVQTYG